MNYWKDEQMSFPFSVITFNLQIFTTSIRLQPEVVTGYQVMMAHFPFNQRMKLL